MWSFVVGVGGVVVVLVVVVVVVDLGEVVVAAVVVLRSVLDVVGVVMDVVGKVSPSGRKYVVSMATTLNIDMFPDVRMPVLSVACSNSFRKKILRLV